MTNSFHIEVALPTDRRLPGTLELFGPDGQLIHTCDCRGKADSQNAAKNMNPDRDPTRPWGDTPAGDYLPTQITLFDQPNRFGVGWLPMTGATGDALAACTKGGRTGLAIHGGRGDDQLMATYGCLRLRDRDFKILADAIGAGKDGGVIEISITDFDPQDIQSKAA